MSKLLDEEELVKLKAQVISIPIKRGRTGHLSRSIVEKYLADIYHAEKKKLLDNEQKKDAPLKT